MATLYGMLGQSAPAATVLTSLYTVPAARHATVKVIVDNRAAVQDSYRIAVSPNGAAIVDQHYVVYGQVVGANLAVVSAPFTVGDNDIVRVYSQNGSISFSITGIEEAD